MSPASPCVQWGNGVRDHHGSGDHGGLGGDDPK